MSLYDEILAAQSDLDKLRKSRIFPTREEATRYADKHGMTVKELALPPEEEGPASARSAAPATITATAAWAAVPSDHEALQKNEPHSKDMAQQAKDAGVIHLLRLIKHKREDLNHARLDLTTASSGETDIFTATAKLAEAKSELTKAEEDLAQRWNAAIARANQRRRC